MTDWFEILRRSGTNLDVLAEALYDADTVGRPRHEAPPWLDTNDDTRLRWRRLARVAVARLDRVNDHLVAQLIANETTSREQLAVQARRIAELERKLRAGLP